MFNDSLQTVINNYWDLIALEGRIIYSEPPYDASNPQPWLNWFEMLWDVETKRKQEFELYESMVKAL